MNDTLEQFLKNYNPREYDPISVTTDILLLSISNEKTNNYRKLTNKYYSVLLVKRQTHPFKDMYCLPGGFVEINENLDEAPKRILAKETNLHNIYLEQLYTFGDVNRDPRMRIISTSYMGLIDKNKLNEKINDQASWFKITKKVSNNKTILIFDNDNITFSVEYKIEKNKIEIIKNENLAFDHLKVIITGMERLKNKIEYTDIVFNMIDEKFTLGDLQQVYEVILEKRLLPAAFRRIINEKVIPLDEYKIGAGHRPSRLFIYKK